MSQDQPAQPDQPAAAETSIPTAIVKNREDVRAGKFRTRLWWLTGLCGLLALALTVSSARSRGTRITIEFREGHGLKAGDAVRYLGIDVGSVNALSVSPDLVLGDRACRPGARQRNVGGRGESILD